MTENKLYSGTNHIYYSDNSNVVNIKSSTGQTLNIESPTVSNLKLDTSVGQVLFTDVDLTISGDSGMIFNSSLNELYVTGALRAPQFKSNTGPSAVQFLGSKLAFISGPGNIQRMKTSDVAIGTLNTAEVSIGDGSNLFTNALAGCSLQVSADNPITNIVCQQNSNTSHNAIEFRNSNGLVGSIQTNGSSTVYNITSSRTLKEDFKPCSCFLEKISEINIYDFCWKDTKCREVGLIADELAGVFPNLVNIKPIELETHEDPLQREYSTVDYIKIIPILIQCIKDLRNEITTLRTLI